MPTTAMEADLNAIANLESERDELRDLLADANATIDKLQTRIAELITGLRDHIDGAEHDVARIG